MRKANFPFQDLFPALFLVFTFSGKAQSTVSKYDIELFLAEKILAGTAQIAFQNQTDRPIDTLWLHLPSRSLEWRGSFLNQQIREFQNVDLHFAERDEKGYIEISAFLSQNLQILDCKMCEFIPIILNETLMENDSVSFQFDFSIKIPDAKFNGIGWDGQVFRLVDWLPTLAAETENGTQKYPQTFFNDQFSHNSNYEIKLTLPDDYIVSSNATLRTSSEKQRLDSLRKKPFSKIIKQAEKKTLSYSHFGTNLLFFISKNFYLFPLESGTLFTLKYDPFTPSIIKDVEKKIHSFLKDEGVEDSIPKYDVVLVDEKIGEWQSDHLLTLEYPKDVFQLSSDLAQARAERIFRYELQTDGFQHVWLARGLPFFYKNLFIEKEYPNKKWLPLSNSFLGKFFSLDELDYSYQNQFLYLFLVRQGLAQKMAAPADSLTRLNYQAIAQGKSYLAFSHLWEFTGEKNFRRSIHRFIEKSQEYAGATPDILEQSFDYYENRSVNWFFDEWIPSADFYDYKIQNIDYCPTVSTATVKNSGGLQIPYSITGFKNGQPILTEWFQGHFGKKTVQAYHTEYERVEINAHRKVPEFNQRNNTFYNRFLFPKTEPLKLQFYTGFENPRRTQLYWAPSAGYNSYDKLLLGFSITNEIVVNKKWEFSVGPEFSFGQRQLTGFGNVERNFFPKSGAFFRRIKSGLYGRYYHYDEDLAYFRFSPAATFYIRKPYSRSTVIQDILLRAVHVERELPPQFEGVPNDLSNASYTVLNLRHNYQETRILRPFTIQTNFLLGDQFSQIGSEADFRWMLPNKRWLIWRSYGGIFLSNQFAERGINQNYYSLGLSGTQDFLFDRFFIGRSDSTGIWSQQFFVSEGGFKSETQVFSDEFLLTTGLSVPIWRAFGVFGDVGFADDFNKIYWDYGIRVALLTDFLEVYLPVQNQDNYFLNDFNYPKNIRFVLNLRLSAILDRVRRGYY